MPFHEKSAWIMSFVLIVTGLIYLSSVMSLSQAGQLPAPTLPSLVSLVIAMVVLSVIGHIVISAMAPKDANAGLDERERMIFARAGSISSYVLYVGATLSLALYLLEPNGTHLFYSVLATLFIAQLADFLARIYLYRAAAL